jgi:DNA-directed RNA polymerase specialized sigma24 family protein
MTHSAGTSLDRLLYDWLAEADDRKFDQAFARYYATASTQLVRYLTRRSSLADLDCEQIAVDALLKFFARVGRERRQASAVVAQALPRIRPLDLGPFHIRQVRRWTDEVGTFRYRSMTFVLAPSAEDRPWKADIQAINDTISPLQRQGSQLLDGVRTALADVALAAALVATEFVADSGAVVEALPQLRVPTNGYLFDIAQSLYLDECKARGRKKRGGSGYDPGAARANGCDVAALPPLPTADDTVSGEDDGEGGWSAAGVSELEYLAVTSGDDPSLSQSDEDFCEQFFEYLRKPVAEAEEALREASSPGRADAAEKRLASVSRKNERLLSVLTLRIEGHTQEAIAEKLNISRNQVKYMVESVQSAYEQWSAMAARGARS